MPADLEAREQRLEQVRDLIRSTKVTSQGQLVALLEARGVEVTQSSVSRDLAELGAVKVDGAYTVPQPVDRTDAWVSQAFQLVTHTTAAGENLLVLKTSAGGAQLVAAALDELDASDVIGTIGGDDTIFVAISGRAAARRLEALIASCASGGTA